MEFMDRVRQGLERVDGWVNLITGVGTGRSKGLSFVQPDRLADEQLRSLGRQGAGLDRHKIVLLIREKLAKEKGLPV